MRDWLPVLVIPLLICTLAALEAAPQPPARPTSPPQVQAAAPRGPGVGQLAEEQIVQLPEDGDVWHCSLFVHSNWKELKADRELVAAFETDPRLVSLKAQTKFHLYTDDQAIYKQRFAQHVPVLPAILLQRGNGQVIIKASAENLDPSLLGGQVVEQLRGYNCDNNRCYPQPQPSPAPLFQPPSLPILAPRFEPVPDILPGGGMFSALRWLSSHWGYVAAAAVGLFLFLRRRPDSGTSAAIELLRGMLERQEPASTRRTRSRKK